MSTRLEASIAVFFGQISLIRAAKEFNAPGAASVTKWLKILNEHGGKGLRSFKVGKRRTFHTTKTPELVEAIEEPSKS